MDFSVIIPTYNRAQFLRLAIVSVLKQKGVTFEIIVSDDASTDDTRSIVTSFHDKRIRYSKNTSRLGTSMNMRKCILMAKGTYIFTLGDDDFILDRKTLHGVRTIMNKYRLGMGKIGAVGYKHIPSDPYQTFILSKHIQIYKPDKEQNILKQSIPFGLGYFSGLIFNNRYLRKKYLQKNHRCFTDHMCLSYHAAAYDLILNYGIGYIPNYFVVGRLSLDLIPRYFNLNTHGRLFMEEPITIASRFIKGDSLRQFTQEYLRSQLALLPNIKYYAGYRNYINVIKTMLKIDKSLTSDLSFITWSILGSLPNSMISALKYLSIQFTRNKIRSILDKYHYSKKVIFYE